MPKTVGFIYRHGFRSPTSMNARCGMLGRLCLVLVVVNAAEVVQPANQTVASLPTPLLPARSEGADVATSLPRLHDEVIQLNDRDSYLERGRNLSGGPPIPLVNAQLRAERNGSLPEQQVENGHKRRTKRAILRYSQVDWTDLLPFELAFQAPNRAYISAARTLWRKKGCTYQLPCVKWLGPDERLFAYRSPMDNSNEFDYQPREYANNSVALQSSSIPGSYIGTEAEPLLHFETVQGGGFRIFILKGNKKWGKPLYCENTDPRENVFRLIKTAKPERVQQVTILKSAPIAESSRFFQYTRFETCDTPRAFHRDIKGYYFWTTDYGTMTIPGILLDTPGINGWVEGHQFPKQVRLERGDLWKRVNSPLSIAVALNQKQWARVDEEVRFRNQALKWRGELSYDRKGVTRRVTGRVYLQEPVQYTMVPAKWKNLKPVRVCNLNPGQPLV